MFSLHYLFYCLILILIVFPFDVASDSTFPSYNYSFFCKGHYTPCQEKEIEYKYFGDIIDLLDFEVVPTEDGQSQLSGSIKFLVQLENPIILKADVFHEVRGIWYQTLPTYTIHDLCEVLFKEDEYWYSFTKELIGDERICPPVKDLEISLHDADIGGRYIYPSKLEEGDYKLEVSVLYQKDFYCISLEGTIYKE